MVPQSSAQVSVTPCPTHDIKLDRFEKIWMIQEAQRAALAALVHAISRLDTTIYCGEGRTSGECREVERNSWNAHSALSEP